MSKEMSKIVGAKQINTNQITIGWIDGGTTEGKFTQGLVETLLTCPLPLFHYLRATGTVIAGNRNILFNTWLNEEYTDWLLWVDSDIVLTSDAVLKLWNSAHPTERPVVSGLYFVTYQKEQSMFKAVPAIYKQSEKDPMLYDSIMDFKPDSLIEVDCSGLGFVLIHRNAARKMVEHHGDIDFFQLRPGEDNFYAEDFVFFRNVKEAGVPVYAHTGAAVEHIKKFPLNLDYFNATNK